MNWVRAGRAVLMGTLLVSSTACESGLTPTAPTAPPTPPGPSVFAPQFSGLWAGAALFTKVSSVVDGECVEPALQTQVGTTENVTMTVTQDAQHLTARLSSGSTGLSCSYTGTAAQDTLALDSGIPAEPTAANCDAPMLLLRCSATGPVRELRLLGSTVQGTMTGGRINGTMANSYNVFGVADPDKGDGVTRVIVNYQFTAAKLP